MTRIEAREERKDRIWVYRVDPRFDPDDKKRGFQERVTAYCQQDFSFEVGDTVWQRATLSWYSVGSVKADEGENFAKAIAMCAEKVREMDAEHNFTIIERVTPIVTIEVCSWCNSPRPIGVSGAEKLPPGRHDVKMQLSHGMCVPCGTKFSDGIKKGGVTQDDTLKKHNTAGGSV